MSLPHAILTALLEKPSSGLELTRRFDKSIGFFWPATHQQIYRELGKLEQAGHIRALASTAPTRGGRKEYEVLPAGRAELATWPAGSDDPRPLRDALSVRLRAAAVVGTAGLEAEIERHLAVHREQLAAYRAFEARDFGTPDGTTEAATEGTTGEATDDACGASAADGDAADGVAKGPGAGVEPSERARVLHHVVLRGGIRVETFWIDWLSEALEAVRSLNELKGDTP